MLRGEDETAGGRRKPAAPRGHVELEPAPVPRRRSAADLFLLRAPGGPTASARGLLRWRFLARGFLGGCTTLRSRLLAFGRACLLRGGLRRLLCRRARRFLGRLGGGLGHGFLGRRRLGRW